MGGRRLAGSLAARINVTVPLAAILGLSDTPGEVAAFGPVDADVTRDLIRAAGLHPATRWCVTVVSPDGQAIGHGCAHGRHPAPAFSPDSGTDPPRTGGSPRAAGSPPGGGNSPPGGGTAPRAAGTAPRAAGTAPRAAVMARPAGAAVPAATGRPATAAARVPAVVLKAQVRATAAARPATAAVRAVPGTGRGTRRQARYHRFPP